MSENVLSVIGDDPHWTPPPLTTEQATSNWRQFLPDAGHVAAETFGGVQVVDQGANFETSPVRPARRLWTSRGGPGTWTLPTPLSQRASAISLC